MTLGPTWETWTREAFDAGDVRHGKPGMQENRRGKPRHGRGSPFAVRHGGAATRGVSAYTVDCPYQSLTEDSRSEMPGLPSRCPGAGIAPSDPRASRSTPPLHCCRPSPARNPPRTDGGSPSRTLEPSRPRPRPRLFDPLRETFHSPSRRSLARLGSYRRIRTQHRRRRRRAGGKYIGRAEAAARTSSPPIGNVEVVCLRLRLLPAHFKFRAVAACLQLACDGEGSWNRYFDARGHACICGGHACVCADDGGAGQRIRRRWDGGGPGGGGWSMFGVGRRWASRAGSG